MVTAILSVILALTLFETYAHTYAQVYWLLAHTETEAVSLIHPFYNGSSVFSCGNTRWLAIWQIPRPNPTANAISVYVFKLTENEGSPNHRGIEFLGLDAESNSSSVGFANSFDRISNQNDYVVVVIDYEIYDTGTYRLGLRLKVRGFERTILGLWPHDSVEVPINATIHYGP